MRDPAGEAPINEESQGPSLSDEITRSLGTVWQRYAGERPSETSTEIRQDVVKCTMKDAVASFKTGPASNGDADGDDNGKDPEAPNPARYRNDAIAAVAKATRRRVMAYIPKRDEKTDVATDTFILERLRRGNR